MDLGNCVLVILFWPYFLHWYPSQCGEDVLLCLCPAKCTREQQRQIRSACNNLLEQIKHRAHRWGAAGLVHLSVAQAGAGQRTTHSLGMLSSRLRRGGASRAGAIISIVGGGGWDVDGGARAGELMMERQTVKARDTSCRMNAAVASAWPCPRSARRASARSCAVSSWPRVSSRITASCSSSDAELLLPLPPRRDCVCMAARAGRPPG